MRDWEENFDILIRSRTPLILVRTKEEERLERLLKNSCIRLEDRRLGIWDSIKGLKGISNEDGKCSNNPLGILKWLNELENSKATILLAKDFHRFCEDPSISRTLKNLSNSLRETNHNLIISSPEWIPPEEIEESITILDLPLPNSYEIKNLINNIATSTNSNIEEKTLEDLTQACSGLSEARVRQVAARSLTLRGRIGKDDLKEILEEKKQNIAKSEVLEFCDISTSQKEIGGLEILKSWLLQRHQAFSSEAREYGLPIPRGVLLVGPQGTGKSLISKAIANSWSMPLLRLDVGRLFSGIVGASEARTRETIKRAEAMSPCILWIDEIDKGFGGDARSDGGTSQRVLASVLTWMSEKQTSVFVVATANAVNNLPGELLRKGRFDEIFFLDLPTHKERHSILQIHIKKRRPNAGIDLSTIVDRTEGFSGAELEQSVIEAMHLAFAERREITETDLIKASVELVPLSRTAKEQIDSLKIWVSSGRARPASNISKLNN
tara:strand:+ start:7261 stop:8748 length:1488 start_codon:yes stop_codon:yes gene_type:complete